MFWERNYRETSACTDSQKPLRGTEVGHIAGSPFLCKVLALPPPHLFARVPVPLTGQPPPPLLYLVSHGLLSILPLAKGCDLAYLVLILRAFSRLAPSGLISHCSLLLWAHC